MVKIDDDDEKVFRSQFPKRPLLLSTINLLIPIIFYCWEPVYLTASRKH